MLQESSKNVDWISFLTEKHGKKLPADMLRDAKQYFQENGVQLRVQNQKGKGTTLSFLLLLLLFLKPCYLGFGCCFCRYGQRAKDRISGQPASRSRH